MQGVFEVSGHDAAGRRGELHVPRADATVQTPALLPVVNPNVQTLPPERIGELGAEILITNSYIIYADDELRERALSEGLHEWLDFSGAVMTDSGSFQLAEYGEIDVTTEEILAFQHEIGSDIGTPVDLPTPPGASRKRAERELATTQQRIETAAAAETDEMLVTAPIQGSTYPELRERAAQKAYAIGLDVYPVGAAVPLLNEYRFADVIEIVVAAKRGLGADVPVHLFGAGHPMMFALAAAAGCDLFDSAAYALYARDDRYLTVRGTEQLGELSELPCSCAVCGEHTPETLTGLDEQSRQRLLAEHNLRVSFAELRRIRDAIGRGTLLELVETRARGHPALLDGYRRLLEDVAWLRETDPVTKERFLYLSAESARRPEVRRHHDRLARVETPDSVVLGEDWPVRPPFGPVPPGIEEAYPVDGTRPERLGSAAYEAAARGVKRLVETHPGTNFTLCHDGWPAAALSAVPDQVTVRQGGES